ncbi:MAG TPA: hypothetical protein DCF33_18425 [Saprospirales bacterium]|nr:hypothetical protein [Saprospirales bacterium]
MTFLVGCSSQDNKKSEENTAPQTRRETLTPQIQQSKPAGIALFIDSMKTANYLLDTNRIKQTTWSFIEKYPKTVDQGHLIIQLPFPVGQYANHFTNPKTYFFAHWNEREQTFKNGNDYLLMTWNIDSTGIKNEKNIYTALHEFMGNFPCYIFRSENTVYAMSHRMSVSATDTRALTERLRYFIDPHAIIYHPYRGEEPK